MGGLLFGAGDLPKGFHKLRYYGLAPDDAPEPKPTPSTDDDTEIAETIEEDDSFDFGHNRDNVDGDGGAK